MFAGFIFQKSGRARRLHTNFYRHTRRCAQFSSGVENLIHRAGAASDF
jgi:hypothetical protein